jgi:hypothetical protein
VSAQLRRLQATLEALYQVDAAADVVDFLVDADQRRDLERHLGRAMPPGREALWILQEDDDVSVALVLDEGLADADALDDADLDRHCTLLEGVSHFVYFADRARQQRSLTLLEMELQAEVDKYLGTWVVHHEARAPLDLERLEERLFVHVRFPEGVETQRYVAANRLAQRYCGWLARTYLRPDRMDRLLSEVRRFWRMGHSDKIAHIESR